MNNLVSNLGKMPTTFEDGWKLSEILAKSELVPKRYRNKPNDIFVALQMGAELGISPCQALQGISVINGSASVYGKVMLGLVQNHPEFLGMEETIDKDTLTVKCVIKRRNRTPSIGTFSWEEAKKARLDRKEGPWQQFPRRMMQWRARGYAIADGFADVTCGLYLTEEMMGTEKEENIKLPKEIENAATSTEQTNHLKNLIKKSKVVKDDIDFESETLDLSEWDEELSVNPQPISEDKIIDEISEEIIASSDNNKKYPLELDEVMERINSRMAKKNKEEEHENK